MFLTMLTILTLEANAPQYIPPKREPPKSQQVALITKAEKPKDKKPYTPPPCSDTDRDQTNNCGPAETEGTGGGAAGRTPSGRSSTKVNTAT